MRGWRGRLYVADPGRVIQKKGARWRRQLKTEKKYLSINIFARKMCQLKISYYLYDLDKLVILGIALLSSVTIKYYKYHVLVLL